MPFVDAAGLRVHVQRLGPARAADLGHPPVVMLHGLLVGNLATWYLTAGPSLARDRAVWLYDLRGHGRSEVGVSGYGPQALAEDLRQLCAVLELDGRPVDLVGHSYGGLVALFFALRYPERVHRLVLVEAPLPPLGVGGLRELSELSLEQIAARLPLPAVVRAQICVDGRRARRFWEGVRRLVCETTLMADLAAAPSVQAARLQALQVPTLLLYGTRSEQVLFGRRLGRLLPQATLTLLPSGHHPHLEARDLLVRALAGFLGVDRPHDGKRSGFSAQLAATSTGFPLDASAARA